MLEPWRSPQGQHLRQPTREAVQAIVARVAADENLTPADILGADRRGGKWKARVRAISLIISETGCSRNGLAETSGWCRRTIQFALAEAAGRPRWPPSERRAA